MSDETFEKLLAGQGLKTDEEKQALVCLGTKELAQLSLQLVNQRRRLRQQLAKEQKERKAAESAFQRVITPPWLPGTVLRQTADGKLDVLAMDRRQIVGWSPELPPGALEPGAGVFLNAELTAVVAGDPDGFAAGSVATVVEVGERNVILRGAGDEELAALRPPQLALESGDRVLVANGYPLILERLPARKQASFVLEPAPDTRFEDIGGMAEVIGAIRRELDLHLLHRERVSAYGLELMRGMVVAGPPGVGKTMLARAIANYLGASSLEARFLAVPPGGLRSMWYGQAEARIRELFALARSSPGICVLFFDELDALGRRGEGIGQDIDGRVLGALLHELSGIASEGRFLCVGATNRIDLCDPALVRGGRFGDRIFVVPRPGRAATRQILERYLRPELPYADGEDAAALVEAGVAYLHTPEGGAGVIASLTLTDATQVDVRAPHVLSGSLIASAVERAKHAAAYRALDGAAGLVVADLLTALDDALVSEAGKFESPAAARALLDLPRARDIVRVRLPAERRLRRHHYRRAA